MLEKIIKNKSQLLHILTIIIGAIFMLSCALHSNIWFDEAYTLGLVNHNFVEMIKIGINDVHPLAYYVLLKIFTIFTGKSIIAMRMFSILGMVVLSIIGFTHIRKDFGEKTGLIFSFLVDFLPICLVYSSEIRMYTWTAVTVILTGIYAYRITKGSRIKDWILFSTFSLISAYMHYFATISIGLINLILFIYIIKNRKINNNFRKWCISAISQVILFIPGLLVLISQTSRVARGFWISIKYPDIFFDILKFNLLGDITNKGVDIFVLIFSIVLFTYLIIKAKREYKKEKGTIIPILALAVYLGVIILSLLVSLVISDIFTTRYTIPMIGLIIFFMAYMLSKSNNKFTVVICLIITILSIYNGIIFFEKNYDASNKELINIINSEIRQDDIFVYSEIELGAIIAEIYPNNNQIYYNEQHWSVEEAYKAFAPQMKTVESLEQLENYSGRIWIIDSDNNKMYDIISKYDNVKIIKQQVKINTLYKNINWNISLIEKR